MPRPREYLARRRCFSSHRLAVPTAFDAMARAHFNSHHHDGFQLLKMLFQHIAFYMLIYLRLFTLQFPEPDIPSIL